MACIFANIGACFERDVDMTEGIDDILQSMYIIIDEVKNQDGHPGQRMFLVLINGYVHCAPYVIETDGTYFLKTAFKSRIFQRRFENGELKI